MNKWIKSQRTYKRKSKKSYKRRGTLLERNVAWLFSTLGFDTKTNVRIKNHEIDVIVRSNGKSLAVECKQYEKSHLTVRNLIYEWATKRQILGVDRVLLVLWGCNVKDEDRKLAKRLNISIWDEEDFEKIFNLALERKKAARDYISKEFGLNPPDLKFSDPILEKLSKVVPDLMRHNMYEKFTIISKGWILSGIMISLLYPPFFGFWILSLLPLGLVWIYCYVRKIEREKNVLQSVVRKLSKIRGGVTTNELVYITGKSEKSVKKLLNRLQNDGCVKVLGDMWVSENIKKP